MRRLLSLCLALLMPASVCSVAAGAAEPLPFTDVPEYHYAREAVEYMYETGLMNGTGSGKFSPDDPYTRAMFVTMLGRMEGIDAASYPGSQFTDVKAGNWAAPYINWAAEQGIVNGIGGGKFAPDTVITEEQYCTIVCRYMDSTGYDFPGMPVWQPEICDADEISIWALPGVVNMVNYNLVWLTDDFWFLLQAEMDRSTIAIYFSNLHRMLSDGAVPRDVYDPAQLPQLGSEDVACILRGAAAYLGNWFYFNSYTDPSDTITSGGVTYEKVRNPYVATKQKLIEQGYRFFVFDVSRSMSEVKQILEQNEELYLSAPDGLGGFIIDRAEVDINADGAGYVLQIDYYAGTERIDTQTTHLRFDQSVGRWVLTDLIYVDLASIEIVEAWG